MQTNRSVFIGSDHAAYDVKNIIIDHLKLAKIQYTDVGTNSLASCDYNDYANSLCQQVIHTPNSIGILICGSGIGISIAANKVRGIRCGLAVDYASAKRAGKSYCNVIAFGARVVGIEIAKQIVDTFIAEYGKYDQAKVSQILEVEQQTY